MQKLYFKNKLHYRKYNGKKNINILFIHGLFGSSYAWKKYEEYFKDKCNIISVDLIGHGYSSKPNKLNNYEISENAKLISELLDYEKFENYILVSHSFGNLISLELLKRSFAKKVIFVNFNYNPSIRPIVKITKPFLNIFKITNFWPYKNNNKKYNEYSKYNNTSDLSPFRLYYDIKYTGLRSSINSLIQAYNYNGKESFFNLKIPIKIINGRYDSVFILKDVMKMIENKKVELVIFESNHIIVLNNFEKLKKEIEIFL